MITPYSSPYLIAFFFFVFGAIIGSFLNVLVLRSHTGMSTRGRSACLSCGKVLRYFELVPIVSFLFLRGRCNSCHSRISFQYPVVEALTGLIFVLVYEHYAVALLSLSLYVWAQLFLALVIASLLMAIAVYDIRHKIIPDSFVYVFVGLSALAAFSRFFMEQAIATDSLIRYLDLFAGPLFFLFFYILWRVSDGRWLGLGDGKLALGLGFALGFFSGLSALILSFWIGAIFGLLFIVFAKLAPIVLPALRLKGLSNTVTMKSEIPFAPFLILGMALVFFFHIHASALF